MSHHFVMLVDLVATVGYSRGFRRVMSDAQTVIASFIVSFQRFEIVWSFREHVLSCPELESGPGIVSCMSTPWIVCTPQAPLPSASRHHY